MTKDNQGAGTPSGVLSRKVSKVYQRVTGNEGPSPLLKQYLKAQKNGRSVLSVRDKPGKTR